MEAANRIKKYLDELVKMTRVEQEEIASLHIGDEREAILKASDLRAVLAELDSARNAALEEAAHIAEQACLVPPDGGSPTAEEHAVAITAAARIRALATTSTEASASPVPRAQGGNTCNEIGGSSPADAGGLTRYRFDLDHHAGDGKREWSKGSLSPIVSDETVMVKLSDVEFLLAARPVQAWSGELPELPEPTHTYEAHMGARVPAFSADQMLAYARKARSALSELFELLNTAVAQGHTVMWQSKRRELLATLGASPAPSAKQEPKLAGFQYRPDLAIRAVLYADSINGEQVCRDDLWLATTADLNKLESLAAPSASASPAAPAVQVAGIQQVLDLGKLALMLDRLSLANRRDGWTTNDPHKDRAAIERASDAVKKAEREIIEYVSSLAAAAPAVPVPVGQDEQARIEEIRSAFFDFLVDSEIDNDGTPETGNHWYGAAESGLQFDNLCKSLGYATPADALIASGQWEKPVFDEDSPAAPSLQQPKTGSQP